ncbi:MAG: SAM-dependent DNA methyltransferase, partial [Verrucomicrobiota bacterium]
QELRPLLAKALAQEGEDEAAHEMAVTAQGIAKAAEILAGQFTLVATNVPYLSVSKHEECLREHGQRCYPESRHDLATMFVERCLPFAFTNALVTPQNWLFMPRYRKLRQRYLRDASWHFACKLGPGAFETISGEVVKAALIGISQLKPKPNADFFGVDGSESPTPAEKASRLMEGRVIERIQSEQLLNPDARIVMEDVDSKNLFMAHADSRHGLRTADGFRFLRFFWELPAFGKSWSPEQGTVERTIDFSGREQVVLWEDGQGALREFADVGLASLQGGDAWGKQGVTVSLMGDLPVTRYAGDFFDNNCAALWPRNPKDLAAVWAFCSSREFSEKVRVIDQQLKVTSATLLKVPFDFAHWQKVAAEKYPHGLPRPFSSNPTQWLFNGHPKGSDQPLQVAVARLLGYQWPRQTGSSFPDCPAIGPDGLEKLADDDGIVCIPPVRGEEPAAERLRKVLAAAYGKDWRAGMELELIRGTGSEAGDLEGWLRSDFFEQHCDLFHQRPFIWHVWDGRKRDGFHALVNYHRLAAGDKGRRTLENLTHSYLGDWITRQKDSLKREEEGAEERLAAALALKDRLEAILAGEPPLDIFVRWKALACQSIGWEPDINDGVRMNIRPFATADILRKRVKVKWEKDRGKEPHRPKNEFPWFWNGSGFTGDRVNDVHLTKEQKESARK